MDMKQPFEKVVAQHGATVLRVCRVILGPHDAEDAWSETFLSAMRAYPDLPETANVEPWLVTIAHRKAIDVVRAAKRNPLPVEEMPEVPTTLGIPGSGDPDLWAAVGKLRSKQRQAVAYHYVAGLAYARSQRSSAAPSRLHEGQRLTDSRVSERTIRARSRREHQHERHPKR